MDACSLGATFPGHVAPFLLYLVSFLEWQAHDEILRSAREPRALLQPVVSLPSEGPLLSYLFPLARGSPPAPK